MAQKITPETILSTKPNLEDNVIDAMQEYAGIKILEDAILINKSFLLDLRLLAAS